MLGWEGCCQTRTRREDVGAARPTAFGKPGSGAGGNGGLGGIDIDMCCAQTRLSPPGSRPGSDSSGAARAEKPRVAGPQVSPPPFSPRLNSTQSSADGQLAGVGIVFKDHGHEGMRIQHCLPNGSCFQY